MAADPATLSAIADILQNDYLPGIRNQFSYKRVLENILETRKEEVAGLQAVMAIRISGNPGIGFRGDNAQLPDAGRQQFKQVTLPMRYLYGRCQFSGPAIAASRSNATAFAKVMEDEMESLTKDIRKFANISNFGDGSGALARIASSAGPNTFVVDRWHPLFTVGRVLDSFTDKTCVTQKMDSKTITAVDKANLTLTVPGHGASVGDYVFVEDTALVAQMGLMGIFDDGTLVPTLQGLNRNTYPIWKAKVMGNNGTGRNISEALILDAVSLLEEQEEEPDFILGTVFQRNDLIKELSQDRQFVNTNEKLMKLRGGIRAVEICDKPFIWDSDCPPGYAFIGNTKKLAFYQHSDLAWMDKDGAVLSRVSGKDAYEATLYLYRELGCEQCNAMLRLDDLNENRPTGY